MMDQQILNQLAVFYLRRGPLTLFKIMRALPNHFFSTTLHRVTSNNIRHYFPTVRGIAP